MDVGDQSFSFKNLCHYFPLFTLTGKTELEIRLKGIDAPELKQTGGRIARVYLEQLLKGKKLSVEVLEKDRHGRILARVSVDGQDINLAMINAGWAWHYRHYEPDNRHKIKAEKEAKSRTQECFDSGCHDCGRYNCWFA